RLSPTPTLFPYTTLFRSSGHTGHALSHGNPALCECTLRGPGGAGRPHRSLGADDPTTGCKRAPCNHRSRMGSREGVAAEFIAGVPCGTVCGLLASVRCPLLGPGGRARHRGTSHIRSRAGAPRAGLTSDFFSEPDPGD